MGKESRYDLNSEKLVRDRFFSLTRIIIKNRWIINANWKKEIKIDLFFLRETSYSVSQYGNSIFYKY